MFKRIKASLANPSSIPYYKDDNFFLVLLYMIVLCFLAIIPTMVSGIKASGVDDSSRHEIREVLVENRDSLIQGGIVDNTLTITNTDAEGFIIGDRIGFILPTENVEPTMLIQENVYYVCKLNDHNIEIFFLGNKVKTYTYSELNLDGLDFSFLGENDYKIRNEKFEILEAACNKVVKDLKGLWVTVDCIAEFFKVFIVAFLFDLVCALLCRGIRGLSFKECLVIVMYAFAMEIIGQIIDALYGYTIFSYIGSFIGIVYFIIAIRRASIIGLDER